MVIPSPARNLRILLLATSVLLVSAESVRAIDRLRYQPYPDLEGKVVKRVLILGNHDTREVVFRREMTLTEGAIFGSDTLWRDWENLANLGLFANIEVDAVPSGDGVLVVVSVYERPRWFPSPILDYDIVGQEITVGYRLRVRNIGGLNQTFLSDGQVGPSDRLNFGWSTPWLGRKRRTLDLRLNLQFPEAGGDELRSNRISVATSKFFGDYRRLRWGLTYFARLEILDRDRTSPRGRVEQLSPTIGAGYFRDSRNIQIDPTRGTFLSASGEVASGWTTEEISYLRGVGDARKFVSLGKRFVLAGRTVSVLTTGRVPPYRRVGVGGPSSIRGQRGGVASGVNLVRGSMELRFGLIGKRRLNLPIPLAPRRIRNFDLRFDGVLFADSGTAWGDPGEDFAHARFRTGFGVGLRVFLPVLEIARLELAFDERGRPSLYFLEGNFI